MFEIGRTVGIYIVFAAILSVVLFLLHMFLENVAEWGREDRERWIHKSLLVSAQDADIFYKQEGRYGEYSDGPQSFGAVDTPVDARNPLDRIAVSLNKGEDTGYVILGLTIDGGLHAVSSWGDMSVPIKLATNVDELPTQVADVLEYAEALNMPKDATKEEYGKPVRWVDISN